MPKRTKKRASLKRNVIPSLTPLSPLMWDRVTINGASKLYPGANCEIISEPMPSMLGTYYMVRLCKNKNVRFKIAFDLLCLTDYKRQAPSLLSLDGYDAVVQDATNLNGIMPILMA